MTDERDRPAAQMPAGPRSVVPTVRLWKFQKDGKVWSAELRERGTWGIEAQIRRNGKLLISRRFSTRSLAVEWATEERTLLRSRRPPQV